MSDKLSRRSLIKGLGLSGLFLAGVEGYKQAKERIVYKQDELPTKELEEQLEKKPVLQLSATYGEEVPNYTDYITPQGNYRILGMGKKYKEGTEKQVSVQIVPG